MCLFNNTTMPDYTATCTMQLIIGTPTDGVQQFVLYLGATALTVLLIIMLFALFLIIGGYMHPRR